MTGAFLRIMRPNRCWTVLHVSILAGLLLTLNAHNVSSSSKTHAGEDDDCIAQIRVRRHTVYNATVGQELKIKCTVIFCNHSPPTITWEKVGEMNFPVDVSRDSHIKTEWKRVNKSEGIFYLIFTKILLSDAGRYQCRGGDSMSHFIDVSVHDRGEITTVTQTNAAVSTTSVPPSAEGFFLYVYSAAGIATFVVIVIIISVISMRGCRGKPKKETQTENQYMEIPMAEPPFPQAEPLQRGSPSAPLSRRSTKRQTPPRQPNELTLPRDNEQTYGQNQVGRDRQRNTAEEESGSVVYAALNHQLPQRPPRLQLAVEESSEYAAVRVA